MKFEFEKGSYTIVVPTYEAHYRQFRDLISSIERYCIDVSKLKIIVVLEQANVDLFRDIVERSGINISVVTTEDVLSRFDVTKSPSQFLKTAGKFTFQTMKKLGGLLGAKSEWSIVLDSETLFFKEFSIEDVVNRYAKTKCVYYSKTYRRGGGWIGGLVDLVTRQCGSLLEISAGDRGYMELNIWLYESTKVADLISTLSGKLEIFLANASPETPIFENVLYYLFLESKYSSEYKFVDFEAEWKRIVPADISGRYDLGRPLQSFLGADHLTYTLRTEDVGRVSKFFEEYDIPFFRIEPLYMDRRQIVEYKKLPGVVAFSASAHLVWLKRKIAVCIAGDFARASESRFIGPLGWIKNLVGFLTGCDCDIFVHGWRNSDEAMILNALDPKEFSFEEKPEELLNTVASGFRRESHYLQLNDVVDGLHNLHSMQRCFELVEGSGESYDFVLKISPNLYLESSLFEIIRGITMEGDANENAIYVPRHCHAEGLNRHIALGGWKAMRVYMHSYADALRRGATEYLGEEVALLKNVISSDAEIIPLDIRYVAMDGEDSFSCESVARRFSDQDSGKNWRRVVDEFPSYRSAKKFLGDKLKCFEFLCGNGKELSDIFLRTRSDVSDRSFDVSLLSWREGNPRAIFTMVAVGDRSPSPMVFPTGQQVTFSSETGALLPNNCGNRYVFFYKNDTGQFIVVEWANREGRFSSKSVEIDSGAVSAAYWN